MKDTRKILITGANSFIGSYFRDHAPTNYEVTEVCVKENPVEEIDFTPYDTVFHVAAIVHQTSSVSNSIYFDVNSNLTFNIAQRAKSQGVKQFVFMSTAKVYGENSTRENPWNEDTKCEPQDAYGQSKLDAERRIKSMEDEHFKVAIIRTPVVYGAGVKGNIQRMALYIHATKIIPLKGIDNERSMVYIGNLMALIYRIIALQKSGAFLAGDRRSVSTSEFANYMIKGTGKKKMFISIPRFVQKMIKLITPRNYMRLFGSMVIDHQNTFASLQFEPPYTIVEGIQEVMDDIKVSFAVRNRFFTL